MEVDCWQSATVMKGISMHNRWIAYALVLSAASLITTPCLAVSADEVRIKRVQSDVDALAKATYAGDVETILRYTYPALIAVMGGRIATKEALEDAFQQVKRLNMQIEKFEYPTKPTFVDGENRQYAIIPTYTVVSAGGLRAESYNFQIGIRDAESDSWTYIEGSRFEKLRQELFRDFPSVVALPEMSRKQLDVEPTPAPETPAPQ